MTDDTNIHHDEAPGATGSTPADEAFWQADETPRAGEGREWVAQLQSMIEQLTTQAAPIIREVGAKAAELAALAGEKAGPAAHRAAVFTQEAGIKLAERSRDLAAELRRDQASAGTPAPEAEAEHVEEPTPTSVG
ncbi:MAG TPA: hypothetical protein VNH13_05065 [Candidatus Acidoferrales bacterium]|nr:hypothetical protein [Candidatus Acidoferrales bacterium]